MAMETRKLQRVGGGTYTVSIPKEWAVEHGLEAGSEVHLYAHADGSIVVRSSEKDGDGLGIIEVAVDGEAPEHVARALRAAHAVGYQTVTLRPVGSRASFTDEQLRAVRRTKRYLVGPEIVVECDDEVTLQNLLSASDISVRQSVVQLQFVALSALRQATAVFVDGQPADRERLRERAEEADRLADMVTRHFGRSLISMEEVDRLGVGRPALFAYYATARELAAVADRAVSIGDVAEDLPAQFSEDIAADVEEAADATTGLVDDAATAVIEGAGVADATDVLERYDEVRQGVEAIDQVLFDEPDPAFEGSVTEARSLTRCMDNLARTVDHGGAVAEVALRAATRADGS